MAVNTSTLAGILAASRGRSVPSSIAKRSSAGSGQIRYVPANASAAAAARQNVINKSLATASMPIEQRGVAIPSYATNPASIARANEINTGITDGGTRRESTTTSVQTTPAPVGPVSVTEPAPVVEAPPVPVEEAAPAEPEPTPYNVYDDPFYQQALQGAQSEFNLARIDALADRAYQERPIQRQLEDRPGIAEQQRRRLAGNFAARGMGGGRYGALTRAEAEVNAREIANRTGLREQIAELGRQFTSKFGAEGTDWLGTRFGMEAQQRALQTAMQNRLGGLTTVG